MPEGNPIKYSDLIQYDDSIEKLEKQLISAQKEYEVIIKLMEQLSEKANTYKKSLEGVSGATAEGREEIKRISTSVNELSESYKTIKVGLDRYGEAEQELKAARKERLQIQKLSVQANIAEEGSYNKLSAMYSLAKIELNKYSQSQINASKSLSKLQGEAGIMYEEMKRLQEITGKHVLSVGDYEKGTKNLRTQIRENTQALAEMRIAGEQGTKAYQDLLTETGKLRQDFQITTKQIASTASTTGQLDTVMSGMTLAGGAFSAATGAMQFLGASTEDVQKAQKSLQAAIAVTTGLTAVQTNLQKQSALMLGITSVQANFAAKAIAMKTAAEISGTKATKSATAAQAVFNFIAKQNPYVLLAVALVTVVGALWAFSRGTSEAKKEQERLNRETERGKEFAEESARGASSQIIEFKKLQKVWNDLGSDIERQRKELPKMTKALNDLGYEAKTVADVENILITNAEAFVQSINLKAQALAFQNLATKEYERSLQAQIQAEQKQLEIDKKRLETPKPTTGEKALAGLSPTTPGAIKGVTSQELANERQMRQIQELEDQKKGFESVSVEADKMVASYIDKTTISYQKAIDKLKEANILAFEPHGKENVFSREFEQRRKEILNAAKELREEQIKAIKDDTERQIAEINYQTEQRVNAIRIRVKNIKDLTKEEVETIALIQENGTAKILQIQEDAFKKQRNLIIQNELDALNSQQKGIELRLAVIRKGTQEEIDLRIEALENQRQIELAQNRRLASELQQDESAINAKYNTQIMNERITMVNEQAMRLFDIQQDLSQSEFDLLRNTEGEKTRFRLKAEAERLEKVLELNMTAAEKLSDAEIQTIKNTIEKINKEIEKSKKDERGKDIYGLFGLKLEEEEKQAITNSTQFAIDQLTAFLDARIKSAETAVTASQKEVDARQKQLDAEIEARNNGYANNVIQAQKEFDLAKKNQDKAIREQQKAQKAQAAIESLQQIGSLVTASAKIWSQLGFPFALAAIGVMWGSFAAAKIKASQISKTGTENFGEGTIEMLEGGSHASGNDIDLGITKDGKRRRAEGGEYFAIFNKRNSQKYGKIIPDIVNSINHGQFEKKYLNAYNTDGVSININGQNYDLRTLKDDVSTIKQQGEKRYINHANGKVTMFYKNLSRTYSV